MMSKKTLCSIKVSIGMDMSKAMHVRLNTSSNALWLSGEKHKFYCENEWLTCNTPEIISVVFHVKITSVSL